jgi:hypothetical protein
MASSAQTSARLFVRSPISKSEPRQNMAILRVLRASVGKIWRLFSAVSWGAATPSATAARVAFPAYPEHNVIKKVSENLILCSINN